MATQKPQRSPVFVAAIRSAMTLICIGLVTYIIWLWINDMPIVQNVIGYSNHIALGAATGIVTFVLVVFGIWPIRIPRLRVVSLVLGLAIITFAHTQLIDNPQQSIFLADILKIFGVLITILGPTGVIIYDKHRGQMIHGVSANDVEIIDV